ncbi:hypothetical protein [Nonomuraea jiangxiensis]|uniref:Lipoprotein n=1 Tax=Nonomuraea jiangxiensis TaxID=633440 RepID=A0A1G9QV58_9ACTN|nr:hypothetical protein [Nonomuraea jiangxiensis]SDM14497.1 hypothetical protein SAMN05421869_1379 [Nonomuraea jiangxiensis]
MRRFLLAVTVVITLAGCSGAERPSSPVPATSPQPTSPTPISSAAGDDNSICARPNLRTFLYEVEQYSGPAGLNPDAPVHDWQPALQEGKDIAVGEVHPALEEALAGVEGYRIAVEGSRLDERFGSPQARNYAHVIAKAAVRIAKRCGVDVDITIPKPPKFSELG